MFGLPTLEEVESRLAEVYAERLATGKVPGGTAVRGPVGLFLVHAENGPANELARDVVGRFGYWNDRTAHYFDGVFLGWGYDGPTVGVLFTEYEFQSCVRQLEERTTWRFSEEFDLLLTDFVYEPDAGRGQLDFSRCIPLDLGRLAHDEKKLLTVSRLLGELLVPARSHRETVAEVSVDDLSDYVAVLRTRRFLWQELVKKLGALLGWADELRPYAVRDLRRPQPRGTAP